MVLVVTGSQWGDEGKGKVVDVLCEKADMVVRYQGGANAGHTVVVAGKAFAFRLLPSGVLHKHVQCALGTGVVVDPFVLKKEIDSAEEAGFPLRGRLLISRRAILVHPWYKELDALEEKARGENKIGTTKNGISLAYIDRAGRRGLRVETAIHKEGWDIATERFLSHHNMLRQAYHLPDLTKEDIFSFLKEAAAILSPYVADVAKQIDLAEKAGKKVLAEGAQGTLLDVDTGTLPFVTSSSTTAAGASVGIGLGPKYFSESVGILKAYTTRVGEGPFPTEDKTEMGTRMQEVGQEKGTVTGRLRRCGWLDGVLLRHAVLVNGYTALMVTKLDVLDGFESLKFCTGYRLGNEEITDILDFEAFGDKIEPIYTIFKGWSETTKGHSDFDSLPLEAKAYILHIEDYLGVPVKMVSTGADRSNLIWRDESFFWGG